MALTRGVKSRALWYIYFFLQDLRHKKKSRLPFFRRQKIDKDFQKISYNF